LDAQAGGGAVRRDAARRGGSTRRRQARSLRWDAMRCEVNPLQVVGTAAAASGSDKKGKIAPRICIPSREAGARFVLLVSGRDAAAAAAVSPSTLVKSGRPGAPPAVDVVVVLG